MVHPTDRMVTVFRLGSDGTFDKPLYFDAEGKIPMEFLPGPIIDLSLVFPPLPKVVREGPAPYPGKPVP